MAADRDNIVLMAAEVAYAQAWANLWEDAYTENRVDWDTYKSAIPAGSELTQIMPEVPDTIHEQADHFITDVERLNNIDVAEWAADHGLGDEIGYLLLMEGQGAGVGLWEEVEDHGLEIPEWDPTWDMEMPDDLAQALRAGSNGASESGMRIRPRRRGGFEFLGAAPSWANCEIPGEIEEQGSDYIDETDQRGQPIFFTYNDYRYTLYLGDANHNAWRGDDCYVLLRSVQRLSRIEVPGWIEEQYPFHTQAVDAFLAHESDEEREEVISTNEDRELVEAIGMQPWAAPSRPFEFLGRRRRRRR